MAAVKSPTPILVSGSAATVSEKPRVPGTPPKADIGRIRELPITELDTTIFTPFNKVVQANLSDARELLASMGARRNIADYDSRLLAAKVLSPTDVTLRTRHIEHVAEYEGIDPLVKIMQRLSEQLGEAISELNQRNWDSVRLNAVNSAEPTTRSASTAAIRHFSEFQNKKAELDIATAFLIERMNNLYAYIRDANTIIFPETAGWGSYVARSWASFPTSAQLREIMSGKPASSPRADADDGKKPSLPSSPPPAAKSEKETGDKIDGAEKKSQDD